MRFSVENMNGVVSCVKTIFRRVDASVQTVKTAKPWCMILSIPELDTDVLKPLLVPAVAFDIVELLDNLRKVPNT